MTVMNQDISYEMQEIGAQTVVSDSVLNKTMTVEQYVDRAMRGMVYEMRAYMASRRHWEEKREIMTSLGWRDRLRALFGREITTGLEVSFYRNCPHLPTDNLGDHLLFIAPGKMTAT